MDYINRRICINVEKTKITRRVRSINADVSAYCLGYKNEPRSMARRRF